MWLVPWERCVLWCRRWKLLLRWQEFVVEENSCCNCVDVGRKVVGCKRKGRIPRSMVLYSVSCRECVTLSMSLHPFCHSIPRLSLRTLSVTPGPVCHSMLSVTPRPFVTLYHLLLCPFCHCVPSFTMPLYILGELKPALYLYIYMIEKHIQARERVQPINLPFKYLRLKTSHSSFLNLYS